jgi:hypothetical protein
VEHTEERLLEVGSKQNLTVLVRRQFLDNADKVVVGQSRNFDKMRLYTNVSQIWKSAGIYLHQACGGA